MSEETLNKLADLLISYIYRYFKYMINLIYTKILEIFNLFGFNHYLFKLDYNSLNIKIFLKYKITTNYKLQ